MASAIAALVATAQFISRYRKNDRVAKRRRLLTAELAKLQSIRQRIDDAPDTESARQLMRAADDVLCRAEEDAAADLLDSAGIQSLRSLHAVCRQAVQDRVEARTSARRQTPGPTSAGTSPPAAEQLPIVGA